MTPAPMSIDLLVARPLLGAILPYDPVGMPNAMPVFITVRVLGGMIVSSLAYRSIPAAMGDPLSGILAEGDSLLTRRLCFLRAEIWI